MKTVVKIACLCLAFSFAGSVQSARVPALAAGGDISMGIKYDGTAWSWGDNQYGQLGNGTNNHSQHVLQNISNISGVIALAVGKSHALALDRNAQIWTWGYNSWGQLGNGTNGNGGANTSTNLPWHNIYITDIAAIAAGRFHSMAVTQNGHLWTFGYNYYGQLGNGTNGINAFAHIPVLVTEVADITGINGGALHSLAIQSNGRLWTWGHNEYGQLGNGTAKTTNSPVQAFGLTNVSAVAAGLYHSMALTRDHRLFVWGLNDEGQLGLGAFAPGQFVNIPTLLMTNVRAAAAGEYHSVALKNDGTVWTWGRNNDGQLGTGSGAARSTIPVKVTRLTNVIAIASGDNHVLAIQSDGRLCAWGNNMRCQTGLNSDFSKTNQPTLVVNWSQNINPPVKPSGTTNGYLFTSYTYSSGGSTSLWGRAMEYQFDFGGTTSEWTSATVANHAWNIPGVYQIRARARSATEPEIMSAWSAHLTAMLQLSVPRQLQASDGLFSEYVHLQWQAVNGAAGYQVWRNTNNNPVTATQVGTSANLFFNDTSAQVGQTYFYWVKSFHGGQASAFSNSDTGWRGSISCGISADYDGDGKADPTIYDEATGTWKIKLSSGGYAQLNTKLGGLGGIGFASVSADYDGDGKADPAVYHEATGHWAIMLSSGNYEVVLVISQPLGGPGYSAMPADYDGDGKADPAVYQRANGTWKILLSSFGYAPINLQNLLGGTGWRAVAADYDGDGKADPAIYGEATGLWQIMLSSAGYWKLELPWTLGGSGYSPCPADYDGDGFADPAVRSATGNEWIVRLSTTGYAPITLPLPF